MNMQPSENCIKMVKHYEMFMPNPYLCPAGVPTIGYGTTIYPTGKEVSLGDPKITEALACEYLDHDLEYFSNGVNRLIRVTITQGQFDALVSFAYNVGLDIDADHIAEGLGDSTLLRLINAGVLKTAGWKLLLTKEFGKWTKARRKGVLVSLPGLKARRQAEAYLFCENIVKFFTA